MPTDSVRPDESRVAKGIGVADPVSGLVDWMIDGAPPSTNAREIFAGICDRLLEMGVPIARFVLFIYTLHPNLQGRRFRWIRAEGGEPAEAAMGTLATENYSANPLPQVFKRQSAVRRQLECP